jgi:hypothetical protein
VRAERENSKKFAESFAGKANYDVLLENPDCGNLKTPQLGHALYKLHEAVSHPGYRGFLCDSVMIIIKS